MIKYIDAEKLISEIRRLHDAHSGKHGCDEVGLNLEYLEDFVTSLQQERPKFNVGDTIHKTGENTALPMTIERIYDGDYVCVTEHQQSFINIKFQDDYELVEQDQSEMDLEKEINEYCGERKCRPVPDFMEAVARHFAEWGAIHLKVKKEG